MLNKRILAIVLAATIAFSATACSKDDAKPETPVQTENTQEENKENTENTENTAAGYVDGTYRGAYVDGGVNQVSIQFKLADNKIEDITFRNLEYKGDNYLAEDANDSVKSLGKQHQQLIDSMVGKNIDEAIESLYAPGELAEDVDSFTAATLRSNKIISAMNDALNRGVYKPADIASLQANTTVYADGTYRGAYIDGGVNQVSIQFKLADNKIEDIAFRNLEYKGDNYLAEDANDSVKNLGKQHQELLDSIKGKDINEAIVALYTPGELASDVDTFTSATLRSNKIISAMNDALNRGLYKPADVASVKAEETKYADGTYRGAYVDGGVNQVSIQFKLADNKIEDIVFRGLEYKGDNYLAEDANDTIKNLGKQHQELLDSIKGKDINEALVLLYSPGELASDVDSFTSATLRSNKILSSINDALSRGLYKKA